MSGPLTEQQFYRVQLATTGKSSAHLEWSQNVVKAFARWETAVTTNEAPHQVKSRGTVSRLKRIRTRLRLTRLRSERTATGNVAPTTSRGMEE